MKNKNKTSPINARPATPPTTPPAIAPTGVFPEDSLSAKGVVEVPYMSLDDTVVDCVVVENVAQLVFEKVGVETVDELVGSTEEASLQKSLMPGPPSMHLFVQNLMATLSLLYPPTQWKSALVDTPSLLGSRDAFSRASLIWG